MISLKISAAACAALLGAGALLTAVGNPERDVSLTSAAELWADFFRDADQLGLQLSRVSVKDEVDLGNKLAARMPQINSSSSAWQPYVEAVGKRVAGYASRKDIPYTFHVIADPVENAFALPGGHIIIYEGLLQRMRSEAELAAVLGHEIAHVDARHCIERFQYEMRLRKMGLQDFSVIPAIMHILTSIHYAQYQELESDTAGLRMATAAGYDPNGITDLFMRAFVPAGQAQPGSKLEQLTRLPPSALTDYLRSHPMGEERVRRLKAWQANYERGHKGAQVYRGAENMDKRVPRAQQEFGAEFRPL